jgi:hypothetical protein
MSCGGDKLSGFWWHVTKVNTAWSPNLPEERAIGTDHVTAGRTVYFRFGKVEVVENVRPLKPKLFGNTHFWLET